MNLGSKVNGKTVPNHVPNSAIILNPYQEGMRLDAGQLVGCDFPAVNLFTNTVYHEGRHTYQMYLANSKSSSGASNDADGDYLIAANLPGYLNADTIVDSITARTVCDPADGPVLSAIYKGEGTLDWFAPPDRRGLTRYYASWALEQDAYAWAAGLNK